jgi:hypothetical protein
MRELVFREAVLSFLGVKTDKDIEDDYCKACKIAKKNTDCSTCNKAIKLSNNEKELKTIGQKRAV